MTASPVPSKLHQHPKFISHTHHNAITDYQATADLAMASSHAEHLDTALKSTHRKFCLRLHSITIRILTVVNQKVFPNPSNPSGSYILTYLSTTPPNQTIAIGTTTSVPPTPTSFKENRRFLQILNEVLAEHAPQDADLRAQAKAFAGPGGANLGSGGAFFPQQGHKRRGPGYGGGGGAGGSGAGGASAQGGAGGGGKGGWVHLSDARNPPDFGRIAW